MRLFAWSQKNSLYFPCNWGIYNLQYLFFARRQKAVQAQSLTGVMREEEEEQQHQGDLRKVGSDELPGRGRISGGIPGAQHHRQHEKETTYRGGSNPETQDQRDRDEHLAPRDHSRPRLRMR